MGVRTAVRHEAGHALRAYRKRHGRSLAAQAAMWGIPNHIGLSRYEKGHPIPDRIAVLMVRDTGLALGYLRPELRDPSGGAFVFVPDLQLSGIEEAIVSVTD